MKVKIIGFVFFILMCLLVVYNFFVFFKAINLEQGKNANAAIYLILVGIALAVYAQRIIHWLSKRFFV
jgi:uncharacterized membrane protein